MRRGFFVSILCWAYLASPVAADVLDQINQSGEFKLGYRTDAPPFSYHNDAGEAAGYSVDLCRVVAAQIKTRLGLADMQVTYVPVTADNRFEMIQSGKIDILCGPTSITLSRRKLVDFSILTFVDGASVLYRSDGPVNFEQLAGKKVGVRSGTTTEQSLDATLRQMAVNAEVVHVSDHSDGLNMLESGEISAYFADQAILLYLASGSQNPENLKLSQRHFSIEPYALAIQLGETDFRLAVDEALAHLYRSGDIVRVFRNSFGAETVPNNLLKSLYVLNGLPE